MAPRSARRKPPASSLLSAVLHLSALALLCGCGGDASSSVHGKVTLDGEAVTMGSIVFLPTSSDGPKAAAAIENGAYALSPSDKLRPGSYRVEISWHKPTGRKIASADPGMTIDETREELPVLDRTAWAGT